jgi:hypothetical protein
VMASLAVAVCHGAMPRGRARLCLAVRGATRFRAARAGGRATPDGAHRRGAGAEPAVLIKLRELRFKV